MLTCGTIETPNPVGLIGTELVNRLCTHASPDVSSLPQKSVSLLHSHHTPAPATAPASHSLGPIAAAPPIGQTNSVGLHMNNAECSFASLDASISLADIPSSPLTCTDPPTLPVSRKSYRVAPAESPLKAPQSTPLSAASATAAANPPTVAAMPLV